MSEGRNFMSKGTGPGVLDDDDNTEDGDINSSWNEVVTDSAMHTIELCYKCNSQGAITRETDLGASTYGKPLCGCDSQAQEVVNPVDPVLPTTSLVFKIWTFGKTMLGV